MANFTGTTGDDIQDGTSADDLFDYSQGGHDTLNGLDGNDTFIMGGAFDAADKINGGTGRDVLVLNGNYSTGITFAADTIQSIEKIDVVAGHSYKLTLADANVGLGSTLKIDGTSLGPADVLTVAGGNIAHGSLFVIGGAGNDSITGGLLDDTLLGGGGNDTIDGRQGTNIVDGGNGNDQITAHYQDFVNGGDGNDIIDIQIPSGGSSFLRSIDAGAGDDLVKLEGQGITLAPGALGGGLGTDTLTIAFNAKITFAMPVFDAASSGFEIINVAGALSGDDNDNELNFGSFTNGGGGFQLVVDGKGGNDVIIGLDGVTNELFGSQGNDRIVGGDSNFLRGGIGNDHLSGGGKIFGGEGKDKIEGAALVDTIGYDEVADSTGLLHDTVKSFNAAQDRFSFTVLPAAIDAEVTTGTLNGKHHFNDDLAAAIDGTKLGAGDAVLFTPDAGSLAGQLFLIVDANGVAGYQANEDYVIRLVDLHNKAAFWVGDFI